MTLEILLLIGIITGFLIGRIIAKIEIAMLSKVVWKRRRKLRNLLLKEPKQTLKYKVSSSYLLSYSTVQIS
ncbi:MAG: hypothetical protein QXL78_06155 [Methanocellales archaeon]